MKTVTKKQIIKALRTEPLQAGAYAQPPHEKYGRKIPLKDCNVCAVGAILRTAFSKRLTIDRLETEAINLVGDCYSSEDDYLSALSSGNYLGALSAFFEHTAEIVMGEEGFNKLASPEVRNRTIAFVKAHFPEKINL